MAALNSQYQASAVSSAPMTQYYQQMVCDSNGVAILAWSDIRNGTNFDLYAGMLSVDDALPVTWLSFSGVVVESSVLLKWETENEINNKGFIIERSADGNHFDSIGFRAATNTTSKTSYTFRDNQPLQGPGFYRLKQIDIDGRTEYSSIVRVNIQQANTLSIFPNPASNQIFLRGNIANSMICIYGSDGRKIKEIRSGNSEMFKIDISGLLAGNYFVTITNSNEKKIKTLKFVKQRVKQFNSSNDLLTKFVSRKDAKRRKDAKICLIFASLRLLASLRETNSLNNL